MFRSLRHYNARVFFAGLLVSNVGTWLQLTAMALLVYRLTGRATDLGITFALQFLPMLLLGAWAGAVADQRDKRTLAIVTQAGLAGAGLRARTARPVRIGERRHGVGPHGRARRAQRVRQPGPPRARHRARRPRGHLQRHRAEHGGDDGLADLRARPRRGHGRVGRHVVVLPAQRCVVRRCARLAVQPARRRAATVTAAPTRRASGRARRCRSSSTAASCWCSRSCSSS